MAKSKGPTKQEWHTTYECLAPTDAGPMLLTGTQRVRRKIDVPPITNRTFSDYLARVTVRFIISGLADRTAHVGRSLSVWSMLVLSTGAAGLVLIRAYTVGLLSLPLMLLFIGGTGLTAITLTLYVALSARRAQITIQRIQIPGWMTEEMQV